MYMIVWKRQNYRVTERSVVAMVGAQKGTDYQRETRKFWGVMEMFSILIVVLVT